MFFFQVHPKTAVQDLDELSSLLQVPLVVSSQGTISLFIDFLKKKKKFVDFFIAGKILGLSNICIHVITP